MGFQAILVLSLMIWNAFRTLSLSLELAENQDTGKKNAGMLVFEEEEGDPHHVNWSRIRVIEFAP